MTEEELEEEVTKELVAAESSDGSDGEEDVEMSAFDDEDEDLDGFDNEEMQTEFEGDEGSEEGSEVDEGQEAIERFKSELFDDEDEEREDSKSKSSFSFLSQVPQSSR